MFPSTDLILPVPVHKNRSPIIWKAKALSQINQGQEKLFFASASINIVMLCIYNPHLFFCLLCQSCVKSWKTGIPRQISFS